MAAKVKILSCLALLGSAAGSKLTVYGASGAPAFQARAVTSVDGPALPDGGLVGRLVFLSSDVTGCSGVLTELNTAFKAARATADGLHPIVLLERSAAGGCSFEDKVLAVQQAGALAAVVFDNVDEGPVQMVYADPTSVTIPAAFVSFQDGALLLDAMASQAAEPAALLAPTPDDDGQPSGAPGRAAVARFEFVSFSAGYLLLFACLVPVAAVAARRLVKRREAVEAAYAFVAQDAQLSAAVAAQLDPKHLPLPPAWAQHVAAEEHGGGPWGTARRFLTLALAVYVAEMLFFSAVVDADGSVAAEDASPPAATAFGLNCAINALVAAALLTAAARCARSLCCCGASTEPGADLDAGRAAYPGAAARSERQPQPKVAAAASEPLLDAPKPRKAVRAELSAAEWVELPPPAGYAPPAFLAAATTAVHAHDGHA